MNTLLQDVKYALRGMARSPRLSFAVVLALAAGIGLNASIFTLLDGIWLRAPVEENPATFVQLIPSYSGWFNTEDKFQGLTVRDYDAIRTRAKSLAEVAGFNGAGQVKVDDDSAGTSLGLVTCNFFHVYSWQLRLGRLFLPEECTPAGAAPVILISEGLWKSHYSSDPHIIGKSIRINRRPFTVVGVISARAPLWMSGDLWVPYTLQPQFYNGYDGFKLHPDYPWISTVGRLKPGYSRSDAQAESQLIEAQQDRFTPGRRTTVQLTNGSLFQDPSLRQTVFVIFPLIMGPMVLILLVACTNTVMLLLSRAATRRGEVAIRLALGARRGRLLRMLGTEGLIVAAVAGVVSLYLTYRLPGFFWKFLLRRNGLHVLGPDWIVFAYLAGVTLLAGCIAGLAPGRESLKVDLLTSLKGQEGATTTRSRTRNVLIVAQMAMSFVLVAAGVLFARMQRSITSVNPGFETRQVFLVPLQVSTPPYTPATAAVFYRTVRERLRELPGVRSASYTTVVPFAQTSPNEVRVPGQAKGQGRQAGVLQVSTDYFATLGIPIVRGRAFGNSDAVAGGTASAAIVSQKLAEEFWPKQDPLGKIVLLADNAQYLVVGVASNTKASEFDVPDGPRLFLPQSPQAFSGSLLVRFDGEARSLAALITKTIRDLDPAQPVMPQTLRSIMEDRAERIRPLTEMILFMAVVALLLALSGVYGVVAFSMTQRTREFGIRMVLGATRESIVRSVLASGVRQIAVGLSAGILLALPAAYVFRRIMGNSSVLDWSTYAISALLLTGASLCAYYIPARRAMRVDPMVALRYE
ncbi:MAG TPA: ADOP family duplicated permease [Candidatus Acidoferrales bacterium]|nr:ADOP family duplicated permease [Candidatus Acidoferrales bacterium]